MTEVRSVRSDVAIDRIQRGLREQAIDSGAAIEIATQIATIELIRDENIDFTENEEFHPDDFDPSVDHLRRARKVSEVFEDELDVDVGHGKFARIASTAGQLSSVVSITIAANNLIRTSRDLVGEYEETGDASSIEDETHEEFYRSSCIFLLECFLFVTPINYQIAWQGTRYVNNQYLYNLREINTGLYRLTLSEVHYLIRGIVPATLRSSIDHVIEYLVWVGRNTLEILADRNGIDHTNVLDETRTIVEEFRDFAQEAYDVDRRISSEVNISEIVFEIINQIDDFSLADIDNLPDWDDLPDTDDIPDWDDVPDSDDLPDTDDIPDTDDLPSGDDFW